MIGEPLGSQLSLVHFLHSVESMMGKVQMNVGCISMKFHVFIGREDNQKEEQHEELKEDDGIMLSMI